MARDFQRSRVYKAETTSGVAPFRAPAGRSVGWCQEYINKIVDSRWWKARTDVERVTAWDGRGCSNASAGWHGNYGRYRRRREGWGINLPRWARVEVVILHELAHVLTRRYKTPSHGRAFCRNYLALVGCWMGKDQAAKLRASFRECGVKWRRVC